MATEQYFQEATAQYELNGVGASLKSWNSKSPPVEESRNNNSGEGFDCNICLDSVQDPVVTMCGHLYCWPCLYKWIHYQTTSPESTDHQAPQCPVCKIEVSEKTLIPLYGRGSTTKPSGGKAANLGITIPQRPQSPGCTASPLILPTTTRNSHPAQQLHRWNYPQPYRQYHPYPGGYMASPILTLGGTRANESHPMVGMFGEMVYARIFGNSETTLYAYPNSYHLASTASPRVRRHMMAVDRSLGRLCFFLFCCMVLCLLLF